MPTNSSFSFRRCASLALALTVAVVDCAAVQAASPDAAVAQQAAAADLTGVLVISNQTQRGPLDAALKPLPGGWPLTPWAAEVVAKADPARDPSARCLPMMPRHMSFPYPFQILQGPGVVAILFEAERVFRLIYTDGREHPDDGSIPWLGSSIGRWEGDVLVVDTRHINTGAWFEQGGTPISDQFVVTERFRKIDDGKRLEVVMKIEDPKVFRQPLYQRYVYNYKPGWALQEYLCNEGNRDNAFAPLDGQTGSLKLSGDK
jgi:hypothetical protein